MSDTNKISIARALVELKTLGGRIERAASQPMIGVLVGVGEVAKPLDAQFKTQEDASKAFLGNFNTASDLIKRREAVKRAVVLANASTKVKIADVEYTLAEAIEMKKFVSVRKRFLENLRTQLVRVTGQVNNANATLDARIDAYRRDQGENANAELVENTVKDMRERSAGSLIAPKDLGEFIRTELQAIEDFEQEVDVALNETNAATLIDVVA